MAKCDVCGLDEDLPFTCNYCRGVFCTDHRLPEAHDCPNIHVVRMRRPRYTEIPRGRSLPKSRIRQITSGVEIRHLLVAWLVLGLCFSVGYLFRAFTIFPLMFIISLFTVGAGFVLHESVHKFVSQRYGFWAEFRLWPWGLIMALMFSFASGGSFIFAAPGATYIRPRAHTSWSATISKRQNGLISLAGPLSNVALASIFFIMSGFGGLLALVGFIGFRVNLWLAAFNMIPLGGIDGQKVFSWSIPIWVVVAIPLWSIIAIQTLGLV